MPRRRELTDTVISNAQFWLGVFTQVKNWGAIALVLGTVAVFLGDVLARPHQKVLDDARELQIATLHRQTEALRGENLKLRDRVAPRVLSKEQYDAIQTLRGKVSAVSVIEETNNETAIFAMQLLSAFDNAGIKVKIFPSRPGAVWTGILLVLPETVTDRTNHPLVKTFREIGLYGGDGSLAGYMDPDIPKDVPLILIGEKYVMFDKLPYMGPPPQR